MSKFTRNDEQVISANLSFGIAVVTAYLLHHTCMGSFYLVCQYASIKYCADSTKD